MTIIGQELKKWRDSLNIGELDKYDITVANIIINNFDKLKAVVEDMEANKDELGIQYGKNKVLHH